MSAKVGDIWYRYEARRYSVTIDPDMEIFGTRPELTECRFEVTRVTPRGVWISHARYSLTPPRFVLVDARKRFACPTAAEALESFLARNARHRGILQARIAEAEMFRDMATKKLNAVRQSDRSPAHVG